MDENVARILGEVIASAAGRFVTAAASRASLAVEYLRLTRTDRLTDIVRNTLLNSTDVAVEASRLQLNDFEIEQFLQAPETAGVIRQLTAHHLLATSKRGPAGWPSEVASSDESRRDRRNRTALTEEFRLLAALHLGRSVDDVEPLARATLSILESGVKTVLTELGATTADHQSSLNKTALVRAEIANLNRNRAALKEAAFDRIAPLLEFERRLRAQVAHAEADVRLPDLDVATRVPIEAIFVASDLHLTHRVPFNPTAPVKIARSDLVSVLHRSVVLGDPGGGKSTLVQKLAHETAHARPDAPASTRSLTPLVVRIRDYLRARPCAIIDFLGREAHDTYQLSVPPWALDYMLFNNRAFLLFDGLDEVLEISDRDAVVREIEAFSIAYPAAPIVVTSRSVGYQEAALDPRQFEMVHLAGFSDENVSKYAHRWFRLAGADNPDGTAKGFLAESTEAAEIRSNPMMLGLMCRLYRGEGSIPANRPELYGKCATLLFDRWDSRRGIQSRPSFQHHLRGALANLAYSMVTNARSGTVFGESEVVDTTARYLLGRLYERPEEALSAAQSFVDYCKGRAWVLSDAGFDHRERAFRFTHQTFLEFFAASYIAHSHEAPAALVESLLPRIERQRWDLITQMAIQIRAEMSECADEIVDVLLDRARVLFADRARRSSLLDFAARALAFLVPPPASTRRVVRDCVDFYFSQSQPDPPVGRGTRRSVIVQNLLKANREIRPTVAKELMHGLNEQLGAGASNEALAMRYVDTLREGMRTDPVHERGRSWEQLLSELEGQVPGTAPA